MRRGAVTGSGSRSGLGSGLGSGRVLVERAVGRPACYRGPKTATRTIKGT